MKLGPSTSGVGFGAGQAAQGGAEIVEEHRSGCGEAGAKSMPDLFGAGGQRVVWFGGVAGVRIRTVGCAKVDGE